MALGRLVQLRPSAASRSSVAPNPSRHTEGAYWACHHGGVTPSRRALQAVSDVAGARRASDLGRLERALGYRPETPLLKRLEAGLFRRRLTLNFHPDRLMKDRTSVVDGLLATGRYLPQAVTGLSNGMRFAAGQGGRSQWERALFGGAYDDAPPSTMRPVYGALDLAHDQFGGSPRFGSSFVVLTPACAHRSTLCVGDSHVGPTDIGTRDECVGLLAGLFEQAASGTALGRRIDTDELIRLLTEAEPRTALTARELDSYIEAQVHGGVSLQDDVNAIVLDPSFRDCAVHETLADAADRFGFGFGFDLSWHTGSEMSARDIPDDFRGPSVAELGRAIAPAGHKLDAAAIGRSAATIPFTPPSPDGDVPESPLQQHKYLWHCLLAFGHDAG